MSRTLVFVLASAIIAVLACSRSENPQPQQQQTSNDKTGGCTFTDATKSAGITFVHMNGGFGKKYFPEINGHGAIWIDYDNDDWQDLLLVQSKHWPGHETSSEPTMIMYHNNRNGTFTDVTKEVGLAIPMYGMGGAAGDYDNDGWDDLYITTVGHNHLFHNDHGRFVDVSEKARVFDEGEWSSCAMWIDADNDGYLDLFCQNYCEWTEQTDIFCTLDGKMKAYCTPELYHGRPNRFFHNNGNGTFTDVTKTIGIYKTNGRSFGSLMLDYDNDGWMDMAVANDLAPNFLFHNEHGTFKDVGVQAGIAYDQDGRARAGMGIDAGDFEGDGLETIVIGNFAGEMDWVFKNTGRGTFVDQAPADGIGTESLMYLTFGLFCFDYDLDGWPDLFTVNGHVQPEIEFVQQTITFKMPSLLFHNLGNGKFEEVGKIMGGPMREKIVGRGAAYADYDNDGDIDLIACNNNGAPVLMRNDRSNANHFVRVKLQGSKSNRDGIGAKLYGTVGGRKMFRMMRSGSSYLSSHELIVTFGLGDAKKLDELVIKWNCGTVDTLRNVAADSWIRVKEGSGASEPYTWQK